MKTCVKCGEAKMLSEFYKHPSAKDGLRPYCKTCVKQHQKQYYQENRDKELERKKQYYQENRRERLEYQKQYRKQYYQENRDKVLEHQKQYDQSFGGRFRHIKHKAKQRNILFKLTKDQLKPFWQAPCHYCNQPVPSLNLDRKCSSGGYTLDNIVPCCQVCNSSKKDTPYHDYMKRIKGE